MQELYAMPLLATGALAELQKASSQRRGAQMVLRQINLGGVDRLRYLSGDSKQWLDLLKNLSISQIQNNCMLASLVVVVMAKVASPIQTFTSTKLTESQENVTSEKKKKASIKKRKIASVWEAIWLECFLLAITRKTQEHDLNQKKGHVSSKVNVNHNHIFNSPQDRS